VPKVDTTLIGLVAPELPAIIIILIVEHIAIAKSFGSIFGYTVLPSQEMIAQGASNILSPFVGGYVCTGSFGASAVLSKAAVRTPLAGLFSAMVLVLALYALTAVFFYIPNAALAGLIIHATANLITPPRALLRYWRFSPFELFIWVCGVIVAFFTDLETAIYTTVGLSFAMLLVRMARNPGKFRGAARVTRIVCDGPSREHPTSCSTSSLTLRPHAEETRQIYLPYDAKDKRNPNIEVEPAYPGVFIYRFAENLNYTNQASHIGHLKTYIKSQTQRTELNDGIRPSDRLWCEAPPSKKLVDEQSDLPTLKAVVLDFSTVNIIDITSIQGLIGLRSTLDRYAAPAPVEWHFAGVHNSWTRRALAHAGFGLPAGNALDEFGNWVPTYTLAATSIAGATEDEQRDLEMLRHKWQVKNDDGHSVAPGSRDGKFDVQFEDKVLSTCANAPDQPTLAPIYGVARPFFHIDIHDAVDTAVRDAKRQDQRGRPGDATVCVSREISGRTSPV
jgi:sodium-independent sulfate anion transporter 11